uniref:t-SNARE coiled-coil homology domain-containing protein n=1 Tax=Haemonchus contortus TaxID=6289 RepID=A0A7I4YTV8_HAECO
MDPFDVATSTTSSNASIDRVVFQIERLSGQINVLSYQIDGAVATVKERGAETVASISNNWNTDTIENVKRMLEIISEKTHNWPLTALIVVGITALILIVITLLFLMAKGGEKIVERRYSQKILIQDHDIESL